MTSQSVSAPRRPVRRKLRPAGAPNGPRQTDQKRATLVDAAAQLFIKKGVEATTMDSIALQAGVAKGTLYHYFASKTELLTAMRERFCMDFATRVTEHVEQCASNDWRGKLLHWIEGAVKVYVETRALHDVIFHGPELPEREPISTDPVNRSLSQLLAAGTKAGAWRIAQPTEVAVVMFYGLYGAVEEARLADRDMKEATKLLGKLYLNMLEVRR